MIRIGVLGCGKIAERHILAYKKILGVKLVVADVDRGQAQRLGQELGVTVAETPEALFASSAIQAVDVCVPTLYHKENILKALEHGKHVFCEKPLCLNLGEALELKEAASASGKVVMTGYLYRFHPAFQFAKETLAEGIIGRPYFAIFRLGGRGSHALWKHKKSEGGGAILEMLVHKLDLVLWYFEDTPETTPLVLETVLKKREINGQEYEVDAEDLVLLRMRIQDVEVLCESDLLTPSYMNYLEIHGENGSIFTSILHFLPTLVFCKKPKGIFSQGNNIYTFPTENLFEKELGHFIAAIESGGGNTNSIDDSIRILRIIDQIGRYRP